jgi:hypothetical protein
MDLVAFGEQKFCQVRSVLSGDAGNEGLHEASGDWSRVKVKVEAKLAGGVYMDCRKSQPNRGRTCLQLWV